MQKQDRAIFVGSTPRKAAGKPVRGEYVSLLGEPFYQIVNYDALEPFFISLVSGSDHWLFIASTGGLSAGRRNAEQALFPYYTVDKLTENSENTGSKTLLLATRSGRTSLWEPFSERGRGNYAIERNLYKNVSGTALVFEEINLDLGLTYRYAWRTGGKFGFVKSAWLHNTGDAACRVEVLDGLQNLLPANITSQTQNTFSPLLDAYKRGELEPRSGLGIFALNSTLTDLAEPSESLLATTVMQVGLAADASLLCPAQLDSFRAGQGIMAETETRGRRGAYFVHAALDLAPGDEAAWHLLADVCQDSAAIVDKVRWLQAGDTAARVREVEDDLAANQAGLWQIVVRADGLQCSGDPLVTATHFTNVLFNVMRGGIFADQYRVQAQDFTDFVSARSPRVLQAQRDFFEVLPEKLHVTDLLARAEASGSAGLVRLSRAYLPLTFSRRHGDPSRPWNRFDINLKKPDGAQKFDYEGNWRDIFQNWEALAWSYPEFAENMIGVFLNATTADGYNPYRITQQGIDWEVPDPNNPWANIGYWSDHQVIYLLKLLEISVRLHPGRLQDLLARPLFSYASVPYRIKPYADLLKDPFNTIQFDWELERQIEARQKELGTDGKFVHTPDGQLLLVPLAEKLLTLLLAKLVNFVPEGGIWMNTQRPEWNDANNALVGKGLSVVTLGYLRRYLAFCAGLFRGSAEGSLPLSAAVGDFLSRVAGILERFQPRLQGSFDDEQRRAVMDALGEAGSEYRWSFYRNGLSGQAVFMPLQKIAAFLDLAQRYVEHSLRANRRPDGMYHTYNVLQLGEQNASVRPLYLMLEGQVSILSSGLLSGEESLRLLQALRESPLYVAEQQSYLLYPDRDLPGFLEKNRLRAARVQGIPLFAALEQAQDRSLLTKDADGDYHFSGSIRNVRDVNRILATLKRQPRFAPLVEADSGKIQALFEETFRHDEFTGRSGTFFAYEGLGSIYWHMVAKLLLAVQENAWTFREAPAGPALREKYREIRQGLSFHKPAEVYGSFPTDPYSHTPRGQGAKQPGMTGLVKEVILTRQAELGLTVENGRLAFDLLLFDPGELLAAPAAFCWLDVDGRRQSLDLDAGSLAYTICQTPVVLRAGGAAGIDVHLSDGSVQHIDGHILDEANSRHIFQRDGRVHHLIVNFPREDS